jgi:hypothetical protein
MMENQHGVCLLGIVCEWRHTIVKYVRRPGRTNVKPACGSKCAGLTTAIRDGIYSVPTKAGERKNMYSGNWEVNNSIWLNEATPGEVQEPLPKLL